MNKVCTNFHFYFITVAANHSLHIFKESLYNIFERTESYRPPTIFFLFLHTYQFKKKYLKFSAFTSVHTPHKWESKVRGLNQNIMDELKTTCYILPSPTHPVPKKKKKNCHGMIWRSSQSPVLTPSLPCEVQYTVYTGYLQDTRNVHVQNCHRIARQKNYILSPCIQ